VKPAAALSAKGRAAPSTAAREAQVVLVDHDPQAESKFLAACLYRFGQGSVCRVPGGHRGHGA
jgi:hypothetical protein